MAMKVLILGATGAAGGSLLDFALRSALVSEVRTISRRAIATGPAKHAGWLHDNLLDLSPVSAAFVNLDACFFCVGRAVAQVRDEAEYRALVRDFAVIAARELRARSPGAICAPVFGPDGLFVSEAGKSDPMPETGKYLNSPLKRRVAAALDTIRHELEMVGATGLEPVTPSV